LQDALKALVNLHDKPLRGRNLVVTYASQVSCPAIIYHAAAFKS
jgi:hypothetical protein